MAVAVGMLCHAVLWHAIITIDALLCCAVLHTAHVGPDGAKRTDATAFADKTKSAHDVDLGMLMYDAGP